MSFNSRHRLARRAFMKISLAGALATPNRASRCIVRHAGVWGLTRYGTGGRHHLVHPKFYDGKRLNLTVGLARRRS